MNEPEWSEWVAQRPEQVRTMATTYPPDRRYRLTTTGQVGTIVAYGEDGTVRMALRRPEWDAMGTDFGDLVAVQVYGIDPADLVPVNNDPEQDGA